MKPAYFDLTVPDVAQARSFFEKALDWRFEKMDMPYEYYRIQAGPESEPGIDGGVGSVKNAPLSEGRPMTQVTVPVANLHDVLARVVASTRRVRSSCSTPKRNELSALGAEHGGLKFGLIEADPSAK